MGYGNKSRKYLIPNIILKVKNQLDLLFK